MANLCGTTYYFEGNKANIKEFHDNIKKWTLNYMAFKNEVDRTWLGNILIGAGLGERIDSDIPNENLRCAGNVVDIMDVEIEPDGNNAYFYLCTSTKWVPMPKMFDALIKHFDYDVKFAYLAEEQGNGLFQIYDVNELHVFDENEVFVDAYFEEKDIETYPALADISSRTDYFIKEDFLKWIVDNGFGKSIKEFKQFFEKYDFSENSYLEIFEVQTVTELYD